MLIAAAGAFEGLDDLIGQRLRGPRRMGFRESDSSENPQASASNLTRHVTPADIVQYGLSQQLVGRFEQQLVLSRLSAEALRGILCDASGGPIRTQQSLAGSAGFRFSFSEQLVDLMVERAAASPLGARSLWTMVQACTRRAWYEVPRRLKKERIILPGQAVVRLRTDSLTDPDGYYGLSILDPEDAIAEIRNPRADVEAEAEAG